MPVNATDAQLIREFLDTLRKEIIAAQKNKGLTASGKSAELLAVEATDGYGELIDGSGSFVYQEYGRGAGKQPPFLPVGVIYEWLKYSKYGLTYQDDKERKSLAFAISRKIAKQGTFTHRQKKQTGVLTDILTKERIDSFAKVFGDKYTTKALSDVLENFKDIQ